jgi:hypothetical protein
MGVRSSYYGGIVLDGLVFHIDAAKQESYVKKGLRYMQNGNNSLFIDFADTSKSPSMQNATGSIMSGVTFSNFAPYHLPDYTTPYWHNPASNEWKSSAGIGTFYGNMEFDGVDDNISFGNTPEMNDTTDLTVSAWFYVNKLPNVSYAGATVSMIASRYSNLTPTNGWELYYDDKGVVHFGGREDSGLYIYATASLLVKASVSGTGLTANGGWYNVVGTKKGNTWNIYLAETNKYTKYNSVYRDTKVYTYPYKQVLLGSVSLGTGTTTFSTNNFYLGRGNGNYFHMNGRVMSVSVYRRTLSLAEINQNYDAFSKRILKPAFDRGLNNNNVLITYNALDSYGEIQLALNSISAREIELGKSVTVLTYANLPPSLSSYSHIWDIDFITDQLPSVYTKYTTYLQGGGAIFILGENNNSVFTARNNSLATFISSVGGGSITFDPNFPSVFAPCKMDNQFLLENSNSPVGFDAVGRFTSIGSGTNITTTTAVITNGIYTYPIGTGGNSVVWKTGSLTNAPKGAIVSVLDVNIWENYTAGAPWYGSEFMKNVSLILDRF